MWFVLLLVTCVLYSVWRLRYFSSRGVRTLRPVPFLGNLTAVTFGRENFVEAIEAGYNEFKDQRFFGLYQYHVPTIIPRDPELIRRIMVADFASFSDRGVHIDADCDPLFGRNLIMLRGSEWRSMRAALTPAFSASRCRSMAPLMAECVGAVLRHLRIRVPDNLEIDVSELSEAYVNDVIASCAFGFATDSLRDPHNCVLRLARRAVVQDTAQIIKFFCYENMTTLMRLLNVKIIKTGDAEQFAELFKSALRRRRAGGAPRPDFIQTLVDAAGKLTEPGSAKNFTDDDLVAQAVLFYVAGYDTTANLISYFLHEMARSPRVQERLQRELDRLPEGDDKHVYDAVQSLEYLEMCICEVLRLWPLVGAADRRSVARYDFGPAEPGGKHFVAEAGVHVWLPLYSLQRDARHWPDPDACAPERFAPANRHRIPPYTYMPFGTGPRHCIGSRFATTAAKVLLARLLRRYSVLASGGGGGDVGGGGGGGGGGADARRLHPRAFILRPERGFTVTLRRRDNINNDNNKSLY